MCHLQSTPAWPGLMLSTLQWKNWNWQYFLKFYGAISRTWINTRLVCTHLKAFFMLKPNMAIKIWIFKNFSKKVVIFELSSAADTCIEKLKAWECWIKGTASGLCVPSNNASLEGYLASLYCKTNLLAPYLLIAL